MYVLNGTCKYATFKQYCFIHICNCIFNGRNSFSNAITVMSLKVNNALILRFAPIS